VQLKMNFNDTNPLREKLQSSQFSYLVEYKLPSSSDKLSKVYEDLNGICSYIEKDDSVTALTMTDRMCGSESLDPLDLAAKVSARSGRSPILHLSGKGHDSDSLKERLATLSSDGISNILAMSGDLDAECKVYSDSVDIIKAAKKDQYKFFTGAVVNPFKYTVNDSYAQYFKMIRKISSGAEYIITQVGWDMKKFQELLLYCRMREVNVPLIARLSLISVDDGKKMSDLSLHKGVAISREFASQVQRELTSSAQFMTAQLRRLCLQIVGCQLMGYSGVQLCGLNTAEELETVMKTVAKMTKEFRTFREWTDEWRQFHHGVSMVTAPYTFYMFKNLLKFQTTYDLEDNFRLSDAFFDEPSLGQKIKRSFASKVGLENRKGVCGSVLRSLLAGAGEEPGYDLRKTQYVSVKQCPKKLFHGPCGGSLVNGDCENGQEPCVHNLRISLAAASNELDKLEDPDE
jgi:methylenetetrahydrofolate reductase (NADPH)